MGQDGDGQLYARIGSDLKGDLADLAKVNDSTISKETKTAVRKHIKEHRGERVERANIARLSEWDMFSVTMYMMSGLAAVFALAGFDMVVYAVGFAALGVFGMVMQSRSSVGFDVPERDRA